MQERQLPDIASAFVAHLRSESDDTCWASDAVFDMTYDEDYERLWDVVVAIGELDEVIETTVLAVIAAGPLEAIVCKAGVQFIDRIERAASSNPVIGRLLTGVWGKRAAPEVWARVVRFCRDFPDPIDDVYGF